MSSPGPVVHHSSPRVFRPPGTSFYWFALPSESRLVGRVVEQRGGAHCRIILNNFSSSPNSFMHKILLSILAALCLVSAFILAQQPPAPATKTAIFAGGCFWCMQEPFDHAKGIVKTVV